LDREENLSDLEQMKRRRKLAHSRLVALKSPVYKLFGELEQAAYREGALSTKTKLLAGIAVSVVINCEACMQWHVEEAVKVGVGEAEIVEMIEVAIKMGGAPAVVASRVAFEVMNQVLPGNTYDKESQ
jgi:AhpD family alkylhydroperoxidase